MTSEITVKGLLGLGGNQISPEEKPEENPDRSNINYIYCFVFENDPKRNKAAETIEELAAMREVIVDKVIESGLHVEMFYSVQHNEIYVKIGASDERLLLEAELCNYKLLLDPDAMRTIAVSDKTPNRAPIYLEPPFDPKVKFKARGLDRKWHSISTNEVQRLVQVRTPYSPFEQLHARYRASWERQQKQLNGVQVYKVQPDGTILRQADRINLISRILERSRDGEVEGSNGAGLNIDELVYKKEILAAFPLATKFAKGANALTVDKLYDEWADFYAPAWVQPIDKIRDYFGEKIAFYFAFLGHYTLWLFPAAIVGTAIFIHQMVNVTNNLGVPNLFDPAQVVFDEERGVNVTRVYTEVPESPFYALFMSLWATFMLVFWKRKESRLALKWGQIGLVEWAKPRPEFRASHILPSSVSGHPEEYYSETLFHAKLAGSAVVIGTWIAVVVGAVAGIFVLNVFLSLPGRTGLDEETGTNLALLINALVIQGLGFAYKFVARLLTDWENHRTEIAYENSLVIKTYLFSFVNSYSTLFYMAFIKTNVTIFGVQQYCYLPARAQNAEDACFGNIGGSLLIIFGTQLFVGNTIEILVPLIMAEMKRRENSKNIAVSEEKDEFGNTLINHKSPAEDQFYLAPYEGTFGEYLQIALQFGYVTLFVTAFPLAPVLAFISCWIEIFVDSFKLCKLNRRPALLNAENIGIWQKIFENIGFAAVLTNAAVIVFASNLMPVPGEDSFFSPEAARVWYFILFVLIVSFVKSYTDYVLPDEPKSVTLQLQRQEYLIRKCLEQVPDHKDEASGELPKPKHKSVKIFDSDPTVEELLHEVSNALVASMKEKGVTINDLFKDVPTKKNQVRIPDFFKVIADAVDVPDEMVQALAEALDNNSNGRLDINEFKTLVSAKSDNHV